MPYVGEKRTDGKSWQPAPDTYWNQVSKLTNSGVLGVWLADDEEVRWTRIRQPNGSSYVTGYTIMKKNEDAEEG